MLAAIHCKSFWQSGEVAVVLQQNSVLLMRWLNPQPWAQIYEGYCTRALAWCTHPRSSELWTMHSKSAGLGLETSTAPLLIAAALRCAAATIACMTWLAYVCATSSVPASATISFEMLGSEKGAQNHPSRSVFVPDISPAACRVPEIRVAACSTMPAEPRAAAAAAADAGGAAPAGKSAFRSMMMARSPDVKQASGGCVGCAPVEVWHTQLSARLRTLSLASAKR
jgi:hypothetical protein